MGSGRAIIHMALFAFFSASLAVHGQTPQPSTHPSDSLRVFLRSYLARGGKLPPDRTTKIAVVRVTSEDARVEEIVYVSGQSWCGSGGCTLLLLKDSPSGFKVLGRVTIVQLPVRLLSSTSNGYPDIGATVYGGGVDERREMTLSFDGKCYPAKPVMSRSQRSPVPQGKVIIANTDTASLLYD